MNITLGLRAVLLVAFVAAATAVIVEPALIGGVAAADREALDLIVSISHP